MPKNCFAFILGMTSLVALACGNSPSGPTRNPSAPPLVSEVEIRLLQAMAQSERYRRPLVGSFVDIDPFKDVNDTYGHQASDRVANETDLEATDVIAERIRRKVRETDFETDDAHIGLTVSIGATRS